jgi:hypothetical protein
MFGINKAQDRLKQLVENYEQLKKDASNVSLAEQVCGDAWHLNDWVLNELNDSGNPIKMAQFRIQLYSECGEFKILHDIANTIKHKKLTNPKVQIKKTTIHEGVFDSTFDMTFDISYLELILANGDKLRLDEVVRTNN